jgi:hypothetical protein
MASVGGRVGIGIISRDHIVFGFGNEDRPRAKEELGTISWAGWVGVSAKMSGWEIGQN